TIIARGCGGFGKSGMLFFPTHSKITIVSRTNAMKLLAFTVSLACALGIAGPAVSQDGDGWQHAVALDAAPKYEAGFEMFDYVNPDAPKGGVVRMPALGGFDTFNPILPQGEAAGGLGLVYESLLAPSLDETSVSYGLLAEALRYPEDFSEVTFRMY